MKKSLTCILFFLLVSQLYAAIYQLHYESRGRRESENGIFDPGGPYFSYIPPGAFHPRGYVMPHNEEEKNSYTNGFISADGTVMTSNMVASHSPSFITFVDIWRKNGPLDGSTPDTWTFRRERAEVLEGYGSSWLGSMSDNGAYIVGYCHTPACLDYQSCYWDRQSRVHSLRTLFEGSFNKARAVSDTGIIVGTEWNYHLNVQFAFIWTESEGLRNLQDVLTGYGRNLDGWMLTEATWINPEGTVIEGFGFNPQGQMDHWSLTLPEPAGCVLLGCGGLFLLGQKGSRS